MKRLKWVKTQVRLIIRNFSPGESLWATSMTIRKLKIVIEKLRKFKEPDRVYKRKDNKIQQKEASKGLKFKHYWIKKRQEDYKSYQK